MTASDYCRLLDREMPRESSPGVLRGGGGLKGRRHGSVQPEPVPVSPPKVEIETALVLRGPRVVMSGEMDYSVNQTTSHLIREVFWTGMGNF